MIFCHDPERSIECCNYTFEKGPLGIIYKNILRKVYEKRGCLNSRDSLFHYTLIKTFGIINLRL